MVVRITDLADAQRALMSPKDRKAAGKAGMTAADAEAKYVRGEERKLQTEILNFIKHVRPRVYAEWDPFNKVVLGGPEGRADMRFCYRGFWLSVECKVGKEKQRPNQVENQANVEAAGGIYIVARSVMDVQALLRRIDATVRVLQEAMRSLGWKDKEMKEYWLPNKTGGNP